MDGLQDDAGHGAGVGDHGQVRGVHLGDVGVRVLGHSQLQCRRDGVVGGTDDGPRRDGLPGGDARRVGEGAGRDSLPPVGAADLFMILRRRIRFILVRKTSIPSMPRQRTG